MHIYSQYINLFIGDSKHLKSLPDNCSGIYIYKNGWINCTDRVIEIFGDTLEKYSQKAEMQFVSDMEEFINESL